ncbi:MAG: tetratricopeptide repeat protein [Minicystis sp.]
MSVGFIVAVAAVGAIGFIPLFDGPGYEIALGAGLILPFVVAITTAIDRSGAEAPRAIDAVTRGLAIGGLFALGAWLTTLGHGLRSGFCDALAGTALFALGPAAGALLAGIWGAVAGEVARGRRRRRLAAVLLAIAGPLATIAVSVGRFYASPMIFAYDPFVGYFSGTLYDTIIDTSGLLSYRAGSAATLTAVVAIALHLRRDERGRLRPAWVGQPVLAVFGAMALAASITANVLGYKLGHWQTSATIAETLGARTAGRRCDVIHARAAKQADIERFTKDCDAHVERAERWFGAAGPQRITAFVFESAAQKGALMGAADTFIAKPWRKEVYVQAAAYPHPVIGHELIHAIAGAFGQGPFRVAGSVGGLLPNPGLIEGVAVAAEPREGDRTPNEWAKAMKDLKILPSLDRLFALGFLGENAGVAYTVSGAFVGWVHDRWGGEAIRAWYGGRSLPQITGKSWAELEKLWHEEIDRVTLPEAARTQAKARFDRPGIFGRRCPHVIDACRGRADRLRGAGDYEGALAAYEEVSSLDPHDKGVRVAMAVTRLREGKVDEGREALARIADDKDVPRHVRDRAVEELADLSLIVGRGEDAAARYRDLMSRTADEDQLRQLEVKIAAASDERLRPALVALLVGTPGPGGGAAGGPIRGPDRSMALELLGGLTVSAPEEGLVWYLLARQYANGGQYEEAAPRLDRALAGTIRIPRARVEAERLRLVVACALGDGAGAAQMLARYTAHPEVSEARRDAARALVERCGGAPKAGERAHVGPSEVSGATTATPSNEHAGGSRTPGTAEYDGGPPPPQR